jgi:hypothetical protein
MKTLTILTFVVLGIGTSQASTLILDVDAPIGHTKTANTSFGQKFTPNHAGFFSSLRMEIAASSPTFTGSVWEYEPATAIMGKMLGSQSIASSKPLPSYSWEEVNFSDAIQQVAGKPMAFTIQGGRGFWGPAISNLGKSTYSGGDFFELSGNPQILPVTRDPVFQTVVAIPEPGVLLTMASTTGLAVFRRRRLRISFRRKASQRAVGPDRRAGKSEA